MKVLRKVNIVKCFALVLAVLCLVLVPGERVEAYNYPTICYTGVFEYDGIKMQYYYTDVINRVNYQYQNTDVYFKFNVPVYVLSIKVDNGNERMIMLSRDAVQGDAYYGNGILFQNSGWKQVTNGGYTYYMFDFSYKNQDYELNQYTVTNSDGVKNAFVSYFLSNNFDDLIPEVRPELDFTSAMDASWVWIEDFRASLEDTTIYMTWGEFKSTLIQAVEELKQYENRYIGFAGIFIDERFDTDKSYDDMIVTDVVFTDFEDFEGSLTFEDFEVPEGYRLWYLHAYPFWFWNDDPEGHLQKGKSSMITFDKDGGSSNALIKDPNDIYNPIDPDFSNWNAITNFTGNYFQNMQQTFDNTFQSYAASGMDDNTEKLGGGLRRYQGEQDAIIDGVSANIEQFNPGDYLNFSQQIVYAMGMASGWINQFLNVSADFTTVFIVGCIMVVIFVVIGIWRFQ